MSYHDRNLKGLASLERETRVDLQPNTGKIGVLLCNLGTPDGTTYWPMRRYLAEFLSERRQNAG